VPLVVVVLPLVTVVPCPPLPLVVLVLGSPSDPVHPATAPAIAAPARSPENGCLKG
jgi:hypothetical protein